MDSTSSTIDRARALLGVKRPDEALRLLAALPEEGEASLLRAYAHIQKNALAPALREVERALVLAPEAGYAMSLRSLLLLALGHPIQALKAGRAAVKLDPTNEVAHAALGRAAVNWGEWSEARAAAEEAMRLAPTWTEGYLVAGALELKLGRKKEAEAYYRNAVRIDPTDAQAISDLATSLAKQGRGKEARELLETGARTDPSAEPVLDNLYRQTYRHVSGGGPADRLDMLMWPPFFALVAIDAVIVLGWIHPPAVLSAAAFGLTLFMTLLIPVLDFARNRRRLRELSTPVRMHYRNSFFRDWRKTFGFVLYFVVSWALPAIVVSIVLASLGAPAWLQWVSATILLAIWVPLGGRLWFGRVRRLVVGET